MNSNIQMNSNSNIKMCGLRRRKERHGDEQDSSLEYTVILNYYNLEPYKNGEGCFTT